MSPGLAAHLRILSETPRERIRTHEQRAPTVDHGGRRTHAETSALHVQILALQAEGLKQYEIAEVLDVSRMTVNKHVNGKIKTVKAAR